MINLEYHKGQPCICSSVFCQEGYCSECEIYSNYIMNNGMASKDQSATQYKKASKTEHGLVSIR
jgi:hypothetical protein